MAPLVSVEEKVLNNYVIPFGHVISYIDTINKIINGEKVSPYNHGAITYLTLMSTGGQPGTTKSIHDILRVLSKTSSGFPSTSAGRKQFVAGFRQAQDLFGLNYPAWYVHEKREVPQPREIPRRRGAYWNKLARMRAKLRQNRITV
jgi:hypothetical protein